MYDCPNVKKYNKINKETTYSFSFSSSPKDMLIDFREKGREGEEHWCELSMNGSGMKLPFIEQFGVMSDPEQNALERKHSSIPATRKMGEPITGK